MNFASNCASCGPFFTRRLYGQPWTINEGLSWTLGTATVDERVCTACGKVHGREVCGYTPDGGQGATK